MQTEKDSNKMTLSGETRQDPAYQGHLLVHLDLHGWRKGCLPPSWLCPGPPGPGVQTPEEGAEASVVAVTTGEAVITEH